MKNQRKLSFPGMFLAVLLTASFCSLGNSDPLLIGHACTDLSQIPDEWIESAQNSVKIHYVHASHGAQILCGLERIEDDDSKYSVAIGHDYLPTESGALCIAEFDGDPDSYWKDYGINTTRAYLDANPDVTMSGFCWCIDLLYADAVYISNYLSAMATLREEYPDVTFFFMTGNAQEGWGDEGCNRWYRNNEIRAYCNQNDCVVYDFEDLDACCFVEGSWDCNTQHWCGEDIPYYHEGCWQWGDDCGHAPYSLCDQKAKAFWWMAARAAGWEGDAANSPPVLNAIGEQTVTEGDTLSFEVTASDSDFDPITLSASPVPPNASFTDQRDGTGDFLFAPDSIQTGPYEVLFTASDGEFSDSELVTISIATVGLEESIIEIPESVGCFLRVCPNPFTNATTIAYTLPSESTVTVQIYSSYGRLMRPLYQGRQSSGYHQIRWTRDDLPSGVYFLRLETDQYSNTKKAVLAK